MLYSGSLFTKILVPCNRNFEHGSWCRLEPNQQHFSARMVWGPVNHPKHSPHLVIGLGDSCTSTGH
eukprot:9247496-Prorocentrum_lima.AAC.1